MAIGRRIRTRRLDLGMAQDLLAQRLGVTAQQIHKYEQAQNRITSARLLLIARALEVKVGWLVGEDEAGPLDEGPPASREGREMGRVFSAIPQPHIRAALLALARTFSRMAEDEKGSPD